MSADALTFVDTNVLVYALDDYGGEKRDAARAAIDDLWSEGTGTLSTQVLQELYVTITRKLTRRIEPSAARVVVTEYSSWPVQRIEPADVIAASELEEEHSLSFWDALILVSAARSGATTLLTEDINPGQTIGGVRIESPFA